MLLLLITIAVVVLLAINQGDEYQDGDDEMAALMMISAMYDSQKGVQP